MFACQRVRQRLLERANERQAQAAARGRKEEHEEHPRPHKIMPAHMAPSLGFRVYGLGPHKIMPANMAPRLHMSSE